MRYFLFLILFAVITLSCEDDCPPNEFVGTLNLSENTKRLLPYNDVEGFVFTDEAANEVTLISTEGLIDSLWETLAATKCSGNVFNPSSFFLADFELRSIVFENDSISVETTIYWKEIVTDDTPLDGNYIEVIQTVTRDSAKILYAPLFVSNSREITSTDSDLDEYSFQMVDELTLINKTFTNVYTKDNVIWYTEDEGLVGFIFKDRLYELVELIR